MSNETETKKEQKKTSNENTESKQQSSFMSTIDMCISPK